MRMAFIKNGKITSVSEDVKKRKPWYTAGGNVKFKRCSCCDKVWWVLKKSTIKLPCDPAILLLGIHPKELKAGTQNRYLCTHVHSNIIHNSQNVIITQMSIDR